MCSGFLMNEIIIFCCVKPLRFKGCLSLYRQVTDSLYSSKQRMNDAFKKIIFSPPSLQIFSSGAKRYVVIY